MQKKYCENVSAMQTFSSKCYRTVKSWR